MVDKATLRIFFTISGRERLYLRQADVVTAYLNADMDEEVYIKLPKICGDDSNQVRPLLKALYGHPKAGQLWNNKFVTFMNEEGFIQSVRDKCFFYKLQRLVLVVLYVDDLLVAARHMSDLNKFWSKLERKFKIRSMGEPKFFLGMEVSYLQEQGLVSLSQRSYISDMSIRFNLPEQERPVTPIKADYYEKLNNSVNDNVLVDVPYKELVGSLIYVMVCTRPDVAFCVSCLTSYFSAPKQVHWDTAMRCLGYLKATENLGLILGKGGEPSMTCYSDSDWASNPITRRSIGGHVLYFGTSIIVWNSKTQKGILALSSTESEYIEMAMAIRQVLYLQPIFIELRFERIHETTVIFGDNRPAIFSMGNESSKSRTKHMDVRLKFCGEVLKQGLLKIKYVPTAANIADIFTKPLPSPRFRLLRDELVSDVRVFINNGASAMSKLLVTLKRFDTSV